MSEIFGSGEHPSDHDLLIEIRTEVRGINERLDKQNGRIAKLEMGATQREVSLATLGQKVKSYIVIGSATAGAIVGAFIAHILKG